MCVFSLIACIVTTGKTIHKSMVTAAVCQVNNAFLFRLFRLLFSMAVELCAEAIFRLLGLFIIIFEFSHQIDNDLFCMRHICFLLPMKIIISISARFIKQMVTT